VRRGVPGITAGNGAEPVTQVSKASPSGSERGIVSGEETWAVGLGALILRQDPRGIDERALSLRPKCKTTGDLGGSTVESYSSY